MAEQEVVRYASTYSDYFDMAKQYTNEMYLMLMICKFYESNSTNNIGIGLDLYKFEKIEYDTTCMKNGKPTKRFIFADSAEKPPLGNIVWHKTMYTWTYYQWALFFILICKFIKLRNIKRIVPSYKFIKPTSGKATQKFINGIQTEFDKLRVKRKFKNIFQHKEVTIAIDGDVHKDIVLQFDTDPHNIFYPMCRDFGFANVDTSQRLKPAVTHCPPNGPIAVDYFGKIYKSRKSYVLQRILKGATDKDEFDIMYAKYIYGILKIIGSEKPPSETKLLLQDRIRKLALKLGFHTTPVGVHIHCLKQCEICGVIARRHASYIGKLAYQARDFKFVDKLWICKCRNLRVCGKKCYKIAWSRNGHRNVCSKRIVK